MKLTPRGFTLVELMIVIAIIGILAAALFPSLTAYLARGRDTSRVSGIKEITTAVSAYTIDNGGTVPNGNGTGTCVPRTLLAGTYLKSKWPTDPVATTAHGNCGTAGEYGYGTGTNGGTQVTVFSAFLETPTGGNMLALSGIVNYQGLIATNSAYFVDIDNAKKSATAGSGYVVRQ